MTAAAVAAVAIAAWAVTAGGGKPDLPLPLRAEATAPDHLVEDCYTPDGGLNAWRPIRAGEDPNSGGWVRGMAGEAHNPSGHPLPTLGDGGDVFPEFVFHSVSPRDGEHVVERPRSVSVQLWKTARPGWCLRSLAVAFDGEPVDDWSIDADGLLRLELPGGLEPGLHGVSVRLEACCGSPDDFLEPSPQEAGHYATFTWYDGLPPISSAIGGRTEVMVRFAGPAALRMVGKMDAWLARDAATGLTLPAEVSWLEAEPGGAVALTFSPALPAAPVDLVVRWRGEERAVRFVPD